MKRSNQLVMKQGRARFYRRVRTKSRWKDSAVPEYDPFWLVRFSVAGTVWEQRADGFTIANGLDSVREWAREIILTTCHKLEHGRIDEVRSMREPVRVVMLDELLRVYEANVPPNKPDYRKNGQRLRAIAEETHGLDAGRIEASEKFFNRKTGLAWVRMRQEYERRGWTVRGAAPADAWDILRAELKAGTLPGIDKTTTTAGNTTILSYLRCAKAVLGETARGEYLGELKVPELREFLAFSVALAAPKGHREIPADVLSRMTAALPAMKDADAKLWLFIQLAAWTGARPSSLQTMRDDALTVRPDGSGVVLVTERKRGNPVPRELPADVVAVALAVMCAGSLIGAASGTAARRIYLRCNAWLTGCGLEGTHKSYLFRHRNAQLLRREGGRELVAAGMGHKGPAMADTYSAPSNVIPMLDPWATARAG